MINLKRLVISVAIPILTGGASALITGGAVSRYSEAVRPPLSPPGFVFPIAWTLLYICMGISFYFVWESDFSEKKTALWLYFLQLTVNFLWPVIFFTLGAYGAAFICLIVLLLSVLATAVFFYSADKRAGYLLLPYILWLIFAGYLNLGVYILN